MEIVWLGHASFKINANNMTIYIDPVGDEELFDEKADIILISSNRHDHWSREILNKILKDTTLIYGPSEVASEINNCIVLELNKTIQVESISITALESLTKRAGRRTFEPGTSYCYLIAAEKKTILYAADTGVLPSKIVLAIDILLVPVGGLLGMGDIEALLEKAKEAFTEEEAKDMEEKFLKGEFNLIDLAQQMEAMSKMGSLGKLMEMVPGMGQLKLPKDALKVQEGKLKKWKIAMNSMTKLELEDPDIISAERIERIANGAGVTVNEIRELLKQHRQSKKMVKMMKGAGSPEKMMQKMQGGQKIKYR